MILTDFAPNESWDDAVLSLKLLLQPWRWKKGPEIEKAKKNILELFNDPCSTFYVSLFLTGRSALYHLLESQNFPQDSEVLIQAFTCEAVVLPILANDLKPIFVDIEAKTFSMNPIDLKKKITAKSRVLILQHTFGLTPDQKLKILDLVKKHKLVLIEDIAHGADYTALQKPVINGAYLLSFGRSKALSSVFGGAIVSSNYKWIERLNSENKQLYPPFWFMLRLLLYKPLAVLIKSTYDLYLGKILHKLCNTLNLLLPEITPKEKRGEYDVLLDKAYPNALSILLLQQFKKFNQIRLNRALLSNIYLKKLKNVTRYTLLVLPSLIRFPLLVENRDKILTMAAKQNIFLGKWYDQVVAPKSLHLGKTGYQPGSCPVAEELCKKIINLPTNISQEEQKKIIQIVNSLTY